MRPYKELAMLRRRLSEVKQTLSYLEALRLSNDGKTIQELIHNEAETQSGLEEKIRCRIRFVKELL